MTNDSMAMWDLNGPVHGMMEGDEDGGMLSG
jgi:hypothetical protein